MHIFWHLRGSLRDTHFWAVDFKWRGTHGTNFYRQTYQAVCNLGKAWQNAENMKNENIAEEVCKNILKSIRIKVLSILLKLRLVLIGIPDFFSHEIYVWLHHCTVEYGQKLWLHLESTGRLPLQKHGRQRRVSRKSQENWRLGFNDFNNLITKAIDDCKI